MNWKYTYYIERQLSYEQTKINKKKLLDILIQQSRDFH